MNTFISFIAVLVLTEIIIKQFKDKKRLVISTKKTLLEKVIYLAAIAIFIVITILYAKGVIHYLIGILGILLLTIEFLKQGIFEEGILILARGKERYAWNEISKVQIVKSKDVKVTYYGKEGLAITHKFAIERYKEIVALFLKNNIDYDIKYN